MTIRTERRDRTLLVESTGPKRSMRSTPNR
jgi:hypothetical protein